MRKKILTAFSLVSIICFLTFSCENNTSEECTTCNTAEFELVKVNLLNTNLNLKKFDNDANDFHLFLNKIENIKFNTILQDMNLDFLSEVEKNKIVGLCLLTNNSANNYFVNDTDVRGIMLYSINKKNSMHLRFFKKIGNQFTENKLSNIEVSYISTNNVVDFADVFYENKEDSAFLLINQNYKIVKHTGNKNINNIITSLKLQKFGNKVRDPKSCGLGCTTNDGVDCHIDNEGNSFCKEDENCAKEDAEKTLTDAEINSYNFIEITKDLNYFRGNYLKSYHGGQNIIDDYYELGENLPITFYSIQNCSEMFDLLENDVVPMINNLSDNPNSQTILIDNTLKAKLTTYLLSIKDVYSDQNDKDKVDNLINKLNFFSGKSNDYITNNLYLY